MTQRSYGDKVQTPKPEDFLQRKKFVNKIVLLFTIILFIFCEVVRIVVRR